MSNTNIIQSVVQKVVFVLNTWLFEKEIARLNKKAARIGIPLIVAVNQGKVNRTRTYVAKNDEGEENVRTLPIEVTQYALTLPALEIRGWTTLARIEKIEGNGTFVERIKPGFDIEPWKQADVSVCDHCKVRRPRILGYVVQNADGITMQMGSKCYADTVGKDTLAQLEFASVIMENIGGDDEGFYPRAMGSGEIESVETVKAVAMAEILNSVDGWFKNEKDSWSGDFKVEGTHRIAAHFVRGSSAGHSLRGENPHSGAAMDAMKDADQTSPAYELARNAIEKMQAMDVPADNEFAQALKLVADYQFIPAKKAGLAAYIGQYVRQSESRANLAAAIANSKHLGAIGARMDFTAKVRFTREFDGTYGVTVLTVMDDKDGNVLTWFGKGFGVGQGEEVTFAATVKAHTVRDGINQTQVTRAKSK